MVCVRPFIVSWLLGCLIIATQACFAEDSSTSPPGSDLFPVGWQAAAPRDEIRPRFSYLPDGGPQQSGAFVIETKNTVAEHGWVQKLFPVRAKEYVRFQAFRRLKNVATPHRSAVVRIVWQNAQGQPVLADPPDEKPSKSLPLAEPEHPLDGITNDQGWTTVAGTYRVPSHATHALIELHLQWAPRARCEWSDVTFQETSAPAPRKVRLGTIHYVPSGKSAMANCEEYAPLIEKAAQHKIDLIVLGETVPYVRLAKSPVETAESIPGPTTEYFSGLAKSHHLHIVVGLYERDRQTVYNTCLLYTSPSPRDRG